MKKTYLDKVYDVAGTKGTQDIYRDWAASYEAEVGENGYATPGRCAAALAQCAPDKNAPLLDFGCGTGLSGLALRRAGFACLDGLDLSAEMLAEAASKDIYRHLTQASGEAEAPFEQGTYPLISAIGVIGAGAAPVVYLDMLLEALPKAGLIVFSFNHHTLEDPGYETRVMEWTDCGAARLLFREHGDHLPGIDLSSIVYVLEKI